MNVQQQQTGQSQPAGQIRRPIDRPEADIPESQWIVRTNRNRLYLWTYDSDGRRDVELYKRLMREPGVRIDPQTKVLYLDYEMRAKRLRARDPGADISQRALEAPFLHLVRPDIAMYGTEVETGFTNWLASHHGIELKAVPQIGGKPVRGKFEGSDCVIAQISSYSHQYGGYSCSWVNFKEGNEPQYCNEFNNIGMVKIMDTYQRLQASGVRSPESMARLGLQAGGVDPVAEAAKNAPMFFASNEERMAAIAEEERKRAQQAELEDARNATNIRSIQDYYASLPSLSAVAEDHVGLQYLREKKVLDYVRDIPELRASGVDVLDWIRRDNGQQTRVHIHPGLILPMNNLDGQLRNIQMLFYKRNLDSIHFKSKLVNNTRDRLFLSLPTTELLFAFPGGKPGRHVPIIVTEGFATGASLYAATRKARNNRGDTIDIPVFVAWDVGNMAKVVPLLHEKYPDSPIFIGADNDLKKVHLINTRTGKPYGNPGLEMAEKIRATLPDTVTVLVPPADGFRQGVSVDFNDVHCLHGLGRVCEVINPQFQALGIQIQPPSEQLARLPHSDNAMPQPNMREVAHQVKNLLARSKPLAEMTDLPRILQENLQSQGRILRRDMRWLDSGTELFHTLAEGKIHRVRLGQGIMVPLRSLNANCQEIAFYPAGRGLSGKPLHLTGSLDGAYYPVSISQDRHDTAPVLLVEDYLDAVHLKQRLSRPYPTIFVGFAPDNMCKLAEGIQAIQPGKHMIMLPSVYGNTSAETTKIGKSLGDFCKNSQKTVKLLPPLHGEQAINHAVQEILQMRLTDTQTVPSSFKPG